MIFVPSNLTAAASMILSRSDDTPVVSRSRAMYIFE